MSSKPEPPKFVQYGDDDVPEPEDEPTVNTDTFTQIGDDDVPETEDEPTRNTDTFTEIGTDFGSTRTYSRLERRYEFEKTSGIISDNWQHFYQNFVPIKHVFRSLSDQYSYDSLMDRLRNKDYVNWTQWHDIRSQADALLNSRKLTFDSDAAMNDAKALSGLGALGIGYGLGRLKDKMMKGFSRNDDANNRSSSVHKAERKECATEMCHTRVKDDGSGRCRRCRWLESQGVNLLGDGTATFDWSNRLTALEQGEKVYLDGSYFHDGAGRELQLPKHLWLENK